MRPPTAPVGASHIATATRPCRQRAGVNVPSGDTRTALPSGKTPQAGRLAAARGPWWADVVMVTGRRRHSDCAAVIVTGAAVIVTGAAVIVTGAAVIVTAPRS